MKFEYKIVKHTEENLNEFGKDGWLLIDVEGDRATMGRQIS